MKINELNQGPVIGENARHKGKYLQFEKLLSELRKRELPDRIVISINKDIEELKSLSDSGVGYIRVMTKKQTGIIRLLEKDLKLVPKNYYRTTWLAIGMAVFGVPMGVVFGALFGNMAFMGMGLPIGMSIGIAVGTTMDKKALEEGRQLDLEIKY